MRRDRRPRGSRSVVVDESHNRSIRKQRFVPSDCIAGDPPEYVEQLLRYTIRNVAFVTPVQAILDHWNALPALQT